MLVQYIHDRTRHFNGSFAFYLGFCADLFKDPIRGMSSALLYHARVPRTPMTDDVLLGVARLLLRLCSLFSTIPRLYPKPALECLASHSDRGGRVPICLAPSTRSTWAILLSWTPSSRLLFPLEGNSRVLRMTKESHRSRTVQDP